MRQSQTFTDLSRPTSALVPTDVLATALVRYYPVPALRTLPDAMSQGSGIASQSVGQASTRQHPSLLSRVGAIVAVKVFEAANLDRWSHRLP